VKRNQRVAHRVLWPILAVVVGLAFGLALALRPPIPVESPATNAGSPQ